MSEATVATHPDALINDPRTRLQSYRVFRAEIIASEIVRHSIEKAWKKVSREIDPWGYQPLPQRGLTYGRLVVDAFRDHARDLLEGLAEHSMHGRLNTETLARRALRIPDHAMSRLTRTGRFVDGALRILKPMSWWHRIAARLRLIGTPQGRKWQFVTYAPSTFRSRPHFDAALDFFLRHFTLPGSPDQLEQIGMIDDCIIRSARRIGIRSADGLAEFAKICRSVDAEQLSVYTQLGVIRSIDEVAWLEPLRWERFDVWDKSIANRQAKHSIARLLKLGVPRQNTTRLLGFWSRCAPEDLDRSLTALAARGYNNGPQIFDALGETLWRAHKPHNWNFVIDVLGAHELPKIALFDQFLERDSLPKAIADVARGLQARGATLDELAQAQDFLLTACDRRADPERVITLLMAEPHTVRFEQLAQCHNYAAYRSEDELEQFLGVLAQHGLGNTAGVLAFQDVYCSTTRTVNVGRLLALYRRLRDTSADPEATAKWVLEIGEKHLASFEYLMDALRVSTRTEFQQIRPFARIGKNVLEWAIEGRGYSTVEALRTWRRKARGIEEVQDHDWRAPVTRILLDDAAARGDFVHVNRNSSAFWNARRAECEDVCIRPVTGSDKASFDAYWARVAKLEPLLEMQSLPHVQHQLKATGGILAASLVRAAWHDSRVYEKQLTKFNAEVDALLEGFGPKTEVISELQADAISAVYGIDFRFSLERWDDLVGLDSHLAGLTLRPYEMHFARRRAELKSNRKIDHSGIVAMRDAIDYARRFRQLVGTDIGRASDGLSPRQMREQQRASTPQTLHRHLGVLLGVLPESACDALSLEVDALGLESHEPDRRYEAAERISNFFDVELGDALPVSSKTLVAQLDETAGTTLVRRLVDMPSQMPDGMKSAALDLVVALDRTATRVREVYGRWIHRQLDAFSGGIAAKDDGGYRAVVSKHGAAYFAKVATKLCSGDNVRMWQERRHSHLVVFDLARKRLSAMAMIYVEQISAIDRARPTLIMRAINTVADADSGHDATSVVRAFLSVGEQIAKENNLAAFAVPTNTDQHLLSNRNDIVEAVVNRCHGKKAEKSGGDEKSAPQDNQPRAVRLRRDEPFYGYEQGRAPADVLYILWSPADEARADTNAISHARV